MNQEMKIKRESIGQIDSVVIKKFFKGLEGGRTLFIPEDFSLTQSEGGVTSTLEFIYPSVLQAGTPILKVTREIAGQEEEVYEPIAILKETREYSESYSASPSKAGTKEESVSYCVTPEGEPLAIVGGVPIPAAYVGILQGTILKDKPAAAIMTNGVVNPAVDGLYLTEVVQEAIIDACRFIDFQVDEEA